MAYSLAHSYAGEAFVSGFNWFNGDDPSNGYVRYQGVTDAANLGLYEVRSDGSIILGVDDSNVYPVQGAGRPSVRLESKVAYDHGLFIGDFAHMPPSTCGLWPAFWMYGPDWPNNGEIDIIEGANMATRNLISAHTSEGCSVPYSGIDTVGEAIRYDCTSPGDNNNAGCSFVPPPFDTATYGTPFNAVGGGVYALEWTSEDIKIWHWPRGRIPHDIGRKEPNPDSWGPPTALFGTSTCDPDTYFNQMSIVIQTNFCGDYAGASWRDSECGQLADTCEEYVANNPWVFSDAYWEVNYVDVYDRSSGPPPPEEPTTTTTIEATSTVTKTVWPGPPGPTHGTIWPPAPGPGDDPASIGDYAYLGCFASEDGFPSFEFAAAGPNMTPEFCVETCKGRPFAAVHNDQCLCAAVLDPRTRALSDRTQCDIPCPGDADEYCGGFLKESVGGFSVAPLRLLQREEDRGSRPSSDYLVSMYGLVGGRGEVPKPAPPLGEGSVWLGGQVGHGGHGGRKGHGGHEAGWGVITVPYVTVCPTDQAKLITTEYCYTPSPCDKCDHAPEPPMRTVVEHCEKCGPGGESEVTLTVPDGHPAGPTPPPPSQQQGDRIVPAGGPPPGIWSPPVGATPTGFIQVDSGEALSIGVAIVVPIAVAVMRLVL